MAIYIRLCPAYGVLQLDMELLPFDHCSCLGLLDPSNNHWESERTVLSTQQRSNFYEVGSCYYKVTHTLQTLKSRNRR